MEAYRIMKIFESRWFEPQIVKKQSNFSSFGSNPDLEIQEKLSDQLSTFKFGFFSPYWLRMTILAGNEENDGVLSSEEVGEPAESLSELEELKGFLDLGFVFSEEDKDSRLASIVPGLQRLWKREEKNRLLVNWRVPSNQTDVKDNLKCWARVVASTVTLPSRDDNKTNISRALLTRDDNMTSIDRSL